MVLCPDKDDPLVGSTYMVATCYVYNIIMPDIVILCELKVESAVGAVEGELVPLDNLISLTNENAVKKV